jgi:hypothetical protein
MNQAKPPKPGRKNAYPANETPISFPMPNVIAAAINPNKTCLKPENQMLLPVNKVMAAPIKNNPAALPITLNIMAGMPEVNINGITGITAPTANNTKE